MAATNPNAAVKALLDQLMRQGAVAGIPLVTIEGPTVVAGGGNAAQSMSVSNATLTPHCVCIKIKSASSTTSSYSTLSLGVQSSKRPN